MSTESYSKTKLMWWMFFWGDPSVASCMSSGQHLKNVFRFQSKKCLKKILNIWIPDQSSDSDHNVGGGGLMLVEISIVTFSPFKLSKGGTLSTIFSLKSRSVIGQIS